MSWNYRVMKHDNCYAIHEVYYDDNGNPHGWSKDPVEVSTEQKYELKGNLELMIQAFDKTVLDYKK